MTDTYVVTLKWWYPYHEAVGAKQVEVSLRAPTTPRLLLGDMIRRYPALEAMLEQDGEGEFNALVCAEKRMLPMHHQLTESCVLDIIPPIAGG